VINDDQIIVNKIIQKTNILSTVSSFYNRKKGIKALIYAIENKEPLPEILLLDINIPVTDGQDFMEQMELLRSIKIKTINIYNASSFIAVEDKNKSKKYQAILGYLSKPITTHDIELITSKD
jgi:two-component SAPR family response regulator